MNVRKIFCLGICIIFLPQGVFAGKSMKAGVYRSHYENRYFFLKPPKAFKKNDPKANGVVFINQHAKASVGIFYYPVSKKFKDLSDDVLYSNLRNPFRRDDVIKRLNWEMKREYRYKRFEKVDSFSLMVLEDYTNTKKKNPSKAFMFYDNHKIILIALGVENIGNIKKFENVFFEILGTLHIK